MTWTPDEETLTAFRHLALQNAIEYEGKAAPGSVIGRLMGTRSDLREHGKIISPLIAKAVAEANKMATEQGISCPTSNLGSRSSTSFGKEREERAS